MTEADDPDEATTLLETARPSSVQVGGDSTSDAAEILDRYRHGAPVPQIAKQLGVGFDHVARLVISARVRRARPLRGRTRRWAPQLDDDTWLSEQLARGAGVRTLSRQLDVRPSTVRSALRDHARRLVTEATPGVDTPVADPEHRFRVGAERAARAAAQLSRARDLQRSAVADLAGTRLTVAAIADRLEVSVAVVEELLGDPPATDHER
ncbi:MAG: hypothetical protein ABW328_20085 [Ilumatobacteraceae bacterium]